MSHTKLSIGIIDLISNRPERFMFGRLMNANLVSIMPQAIAVWLEELGHKVVVATYTGSEDITTLLPDNVQLVFISGFTYSAFLAYALSRMYRKQGITTVLGGPHARAFPADASQYFDYVIGYADKSLIADLVAGFSQHHDSGIYLCSKTHPRHLPGVKARWKFIIQNFPKTVLTPAVPIIGSFGCPYSCSFCIDAEVPYQPLDLQQIEEDLVFIGRNAPNAIVTWYDPNFGVRFSQFMEAIERGTRSQKLRFAAESSLSLLSEKNVKQLAQNGFIAMIPGVESWYDFGAKAGKRSSFGLGKMQEVAEHFQMILRHIPYVQANFVLGVDADEGEGPFSLTKSFLDLVPGVFPGFSLFTVFGNTAPIAQSIMDQGRLIATPFHFLDNSTLNVIPKNYNLSQFFEQVVSLLEFAFSLLMIARRIKANQGMLARGLNTLRSVSADGWGRCRYYKRLLRALKYDKLVIAYLKGETKLMPKIIRQKLRAELLQVREFLPDDLRASIWEAN